MHSSHSESIVFSSHFMYMHFWVSYVTFRKSNFLRLIYFSKKSDFSHLKLLEKITEAIKVFNEEDK